MAARVISHRCMNLRHPPQTARIFLSLATQSSVRHNSSTSTTPHPQPQARAPLDFLTPSVRKSTNAYRSARREVRGAQGNPRLRSRALFSSCARHSQSQSQSVGQNLSRTEAIYNPQRDEDGEEMMVEITPRAANRLSEIMARDANPHLALRIRVESGGCHGFQYLMSLTTLPALEGDGLGEKQEGARAEQAGMAEDDTVFEAQAAGAAEGVPGARIVMDGPSLELLKGSKVDFTMELIGSQFKIVDNPLATSSCGCGTSFDIKA